MVRAITHALLLAVAAAAATVAHAQQTEAVESYIPTAQDSDDIIVRALKIPKDKLPTNIEWNDRIYLNVRAMAEKAEIFAHCTSGKLPVDRLSTLIDGDPQSSQYRYALSWLTETHKTCMNGVPYMYSADMGPAACHRPGHRSRDDRT